MFGICVSSMRFAQDALQDCVPTEVWRRVDVVVMSDTYAIERLRGVRCEAGQVCHIVLTEDSSIREETFQLLLNQLLAWAAVQSGEVLWHWHIEPERMRREELYPNFTLTEDGTLYQHLPVVRRGNSILMSSEAQEFRIHMGPINQDLLRLLTGALDREAMPIMGHALEDTPEGETGEIQLD